jgi:hypothetical protein
MGDDYVGNSNSIDLYAKKQYIIQVQIDIQCNYSTYQLNIQGKTMDKIRYVAQSK